MGRTYDDRPVKGDFGMADTDVEVKMNPWGRRICHRILDPAHVEYRASAAKNEITLLAAVDWERVLRWYTINVTKERLVPINLRLGDVVGGEEMTFQLRDPQTRGVAVTIRVGDDFAALLAQAGRNAIRQQRETGQLYWDTQVSVNGRQLLATLAAIDHEQVGAAAAVAADPEAMLAAIEPALRAAWCRETAVAPERWSEAVPATGQCAVSALIVQDELGGELVRCLVEGESHYYNSLPDGTEVDLTLEQFPEGAVREHPDGRTREYLLSNASTAARYKRLRKRFDEALARPAGASSISGPLPADDEAGRAATLAAYEANAARFSQTHWEFSYAKELDPFLARVSDHTRPLLDVGCGSGRDVAHMLERGFRAIGLDYSGAMLAEAARRVPDAAATWICADMLAVPLPDGACAGIWSSAALLHVDDAGKRAALAEARRLLRPGDPIFISTIADDGGAPRTSTAAPDGGSRFYWGITPERLAVMAAAAGFEVEFAEQVAGEVRGEWVELTAVAR